MARKKREQASSGGNAPWLNTFADLMNLLLCFFVLLFSMSSVDAKKFEEISASMANAFGILDGGGASVGTGNLISSGMTQMHDLGEYYSTMGKASKETGTDIEAEENTTDQNQTNESNNNGQTKDNPSETTADGNGDATLSKAVERLQTEMKSESTAMYDKVSDLTDQYNLGSDIELSIDAKYRFVQLTLKGSILFDSGSAELRKNAEPILSNVAEILKRFDGYTVEITGHTDNVPMTSGSFKDNNWLSSARALYSAEYLISAGGLDPAQIKYSGRGEYEPIADNKTAEGRAKNRRIEIKIYNEYSGN